MYADREERSNHQRAIEFVARESQVPINEVAQLYEDERAELEVDARITRFLPIFAIRKVRETLRQRSDLPESGHPRRNTGNRRSV
jgi:hypothetical protein